MADDPNKIAAEPPLHVDPRDHYALEYWSRKWGLTQEDVRAAVQVVGTKVEAVRRYLNK